MSGDVVALDLFAGTGWGVACKSLDIEEHGVDNMPEVIATREANGMRTAFEDVWGGLDGRAEVPQHELQIASPPCQSFSMAGRGAGRQALVDVLRLIQEGVYLRPLEMEALTQQEGFDDRTALVLTPLAYAVRDMPYFIAWEQVPPVLPVWEACAEVLRAAGYSVWTGYLHAEQYGVPQTRKRAFLIASFLGEVKPPVPTHSKFYSRSPEKLDPGVLPWVSMAEALGWGLQDEAVKFMGRGMVERHGDRPGRRAVEPAFTVRASAGGMEPGGFRLRDGETGDERRLEPVEVADLQSYPNGWGFTDRPATTVTGHGLITRNSTGSKQAVLDAIEADQWIFRPPFTFETAQKVGEQREDYLSLTDRFELDSINFAPNEAAALQSYPPYFDQALLEQRVRERINDQSGTAYDPAWPVKRPAPTIAGRGLAPNPGATANRFNGSTKSRNDGIVIEPAEASALQSYPRPFEWRGNRSKQFLMIGNAVPPLMARAVLSALIEES